MLRYYTMNETQVANLTATFNIAAHISVFPLPFLRLLISSLTTLNIDGSTSNRRMAVKL